MPSVTPALLLRRVREYADQHDEGDGSRAFVTDNMIYSWLSKGYRTALRAMIRGGYPLSVITENFAAPGASLLLTSAPLAILGVVAVRGTSHVPLPRVVGQSDLRMEGTSAAYWRPVVSNEDGAVQVFLYPAEDISTLRITYVADPVEWDASFGDNVYLPSSWEDVIVLGAALRCLARTNEQNPMLRDLYGEALAEAEADVSSAMSEGVMRNTDDLYPPGHDQGRDYDRRAEYDYSPYLIP